MQKQMLPKSPAYEKVDNNFLQLHPMGMYWLLIGLDCKKS